VITIIGTCSLCGGRVSVPSVYHSVIPPEPTCESCGAVRASHGPVIDMRPARRAQQRVVDEGGFLEDGHWVGTGRPWWRL
jgi:hypothetical protein